MDHPKDNPNRISKFKKSFQENLGDGTDLSNGLKNDEIEKLEELNNLKLNLFDLNEDKL